MGLSGGNRVVCVKKGTGRAEGRKGGRGAVSVARKSIWGQKRNHIHNSISPTQTHIPPHFFSHFFFGL